MKIKRFAKNSSKKHHISGLWKELGLRRLNKGNELVHLFTFAKRRIITSLKVVVFPMEVALPTSQMEVTPFLGSEKVRGFSSDSRRKRFCR